jgi:hypothetical protein
VPAQIGLAQVLIEKDANSKEARALIEAVLEKEPANEKAMETARKIGMR